MGHYDECRPGYCAGCGAAPGNIINGVCQFCGPREKLTRLVKVPRVPKVKPPRAEPFRITQEPDWPSRVVDKKGLPAATAYAEGWNDCLAVCKEAFKRLQLKE